MAGLQENPPRPDGGPAEKKERREVVFAFKNTVNKAIEQIQFIIPFETGMFGYLQVGLFYLKYLDPSSSSHYDAETFVISHENGLKGMRGFQLDSIFTPYEDRDGTHGIRRKSILSKAENPIADIGSRNLELDEMRQLVLVMAQTPMHASLIEGLVEPTDGERVKIEAELEQSDREREIRIRPRFTDQDSFWE